jgi:hypothetical protein
MGGCIFFHKDSILLSYWSNLAELAPGHVNAISGFVGMGIATVK